MLPLRANQHSQPPKVGFKHSNSSLLTLHAVSICYFLISMLIRLITTYAVYGYGTLAVFVESSCSVFGLVIVRWRDSPTYNYILSGMLGLAVGSLTGNALMHLIPHVRSLFQFYAKVYTKCGPARTCFSIVHRLYVDLLY